MKLRDYLLDRLPLIGAFAGALLFLLLVVQLGYSSLRTADVLYILLLAGVLCAVILTIDLRRQRHFRREVVRQLTRPPESAAGLAPIRGAVTREQKALNELLNSRQRLYSEELRHYRERVTTHRTFTDQWVHQMKTPLSVLELTVQEGLQRNGSEAGQELWESAGEELDGISEGLELMLAVARLDAFELDLRPGQVDLEGITREVVNDMKRSWIRSGIYPRVVAPEEPVLVESDPKWLAVIIRQILTNAVKYGSAAAAGREDPKGRVEIVVERAAGGAELRVTDHGIGIPEHDLPRVFDRFFTGENGRKSRASTGMGLYLVGEISRRLGHRVELSSVPGAGTTVALHFSSRGVHRIGSAQDGPAAPVR